MKGEDGASSGEFSRNGHRQILLSEIGAGDEMHRQARLHVERITRNQFERRGIKPDDARVGNVVMLAMAGMSPADLRNPTALPDSVIGLIDGAVARNLDISRAVNLYSAEAARQENQRFPGAWPETRDKLADGGIIDRGNRGSGAPRDRDTSSARYDGIGSGDISGITPQSFSGSLGNPFRREGLDFPTFAYLRAQDPAFTGKDIIAAARDAKSFGFSPKDKSIMKPLAGIEHYDIDPRKAIKLHHAFEHAMEQDEELKRLRAHLKTLNKNRDSEEYLKTLDAIAKRVEADSTKSGLQPHIDDPRQSERARDHNNDFKREQRDRFLGLTPEQKRDMNLLDESVGRGARQEAVEKLRAKLVASGVDPKKLAEDNVVVTALRRDQKATQHREEQANQREVLADQREVLANQKENRAKAKVEVATLEKGRAADEKAELAAMLKQAQDNRSNAKPEEDNHGKPKPPKRVVQAGTSKPDA